MRLLFLDTMHLMYGIPNMVSVFLGSRTILINLCSFQGRHELVYGIHSPEESFEWVNLMEVSVVGKIHVTFFL